MLTSRTYWHVCVDKRTYWNSLDSLDTRAEAEAELKKARRNWPEAFLVRMTMARVDRGMPRTYRDSEA